MQVLRVCTACLGVFFLFSLISLSCCHFLASLLAYALFYFSLLSYLSLVALLCLLSDIYSITQTPSLVLLLSLSISFPLCHLFALSQSSSLAFSCLLFSLLSLSHCLLLPPTLMHTSLSLLLFPRPLSPYVCTLSLSLSFSSPLSNSYVSCHLSL